MKYVMPANLVVLLIVLLVKMAGNLLVTKLELVLPNVLLVARTYWPDTLLSTRK